MATAADILNVARKEIGYSRWNDPNPGTKYGRWYAKDHGSYYGASGVPYCAMFVSWVFATAGGKCAGLPEAYCPYLLNKARKENRVRGNKKAAQPGDVVLFNWDGGVVDHVGIVEVNKGGYVQTIEGNTNNGQVLRRTRSWSTIEAIVIPYYDSTPSTNAAAKPPVRSGSIAVDGYWGSETSRKVQTAMGTPVDGIISGQTKDTKTYFWSRGGGWDFSGGSSLVIRAIQKKVGAKVDGYAGPETARKMQTYLINKGYSCGASGVDGYFGPASVKAFQRALNDGNF